MGIIVLLLFSLSACSKGKGDRPAEQPVFSLADPFPAGFLWGTATAGFQVEAGCPHLSEAECTDRNSDWYEWVSDPRIIEKQMVSGDPITMAPGHYELFATDFALARDLLHNNAFRISLEWSRIFTQPTDSAGSFEELKSLANATAVEHYHRVFSAMRAYGLTPFVTLNHYSLPLWIHTGVACYLAHQDKDLDRCPHKGWLDEERITREIAKYARFVAEEYGREVDLWATLNEPFAVVLAGYITPSGERTNPPGIRSFELGKRVIFSMLKAHALMVDAVREGDRFDGDGDGVSAQVGIVLNLAPFKPLNPEDPFDVEAVTHASYLYNQRFLDEMVFGEWDPELDGTMTPKPEWKGKLDFVGINYYTRVTIKGFGAPLSEAIPFLNFIPAILWEFYPRGIYELTRWVSERYRIPIYISENGTIDTAGGEVGPRFLVPHLAWLRKAIAEGADVRGYFYWTHMDNYEWSEGVKVQMGLFRVDPETKERTPKLNATVYGKIAQENRLTPELIERYGGEDLPR
jgi:beta-glucosidase/6-phospho-beta-glucosidase/beta-galactosidase